MIRYIEFGISHQEVPGEAALCIYISGCQNDCENCHYPELKDPHEGLLLSDHYADILDLYCQQASCVCFMGEGDGSEESRKELMVCARMAKDRNLRSCLYCGRDVDPEDWMKIFGYVKTGSFMEGLGDIYSKTTNQRFYKRSGNDFMDVTYLFWNLTDG